MSTAPADPTAAEPEVAAHTTKFGTAALAARCNARSFDVILPNERSATSLCKQPVNRVGEFAEYVEL